MSLFSCLKWPEMRPVALELIARMHEGHATGRFSIPMVDFVRVFAPGASAEELKKVSARGDIHFEQVNAHGGQFRLGKGPEATFELGREGLAMRVPARMSGSYKIRPSSFHITFNKGEELEGCKRLFVLVCNRVVSVEVSDKRVDVRLPSKLFDLCVEFE
ncbi:MAG TPA: hypothetical protein VJ715_10475 [Pyrinomonadaceae bacterium]|nr:hypothetical protein [Pyrinomonadaceae bacterium]